MIKIINCGIGNVGSVLNMLNKIGLNSEILNSPTDLDNATKLILPGVGAFDTCMNAMKKSGFVDKVKFAVLEKKIPVLGICAGMQILGESSEEGDEKGMSLLPIRFKKFSQKKGVKIPHMGWNYIKKKKNTKILEGLENPKFYFVHSYKTEKNEKFSLATTSYADEFDSIVNFENIYGVQFHPEKSHKYGMKLLQNFSDL